MYLCNQTSHTFDNKRGIESVAVSANTVAELPNGGKRFRFVTGGLDGQPMILIVHRQALNGRRGGICDGL